MIKLWQIIILLKNIVGNLVEYDVIPMEKKCEIEAGLEAVYEVGKDVIIDNIPVVRELMKVVNSFRDKVLLKKFILFYKV
ncbi:hypothetical protein HMPREF9466_00481 [Fusobacterium necrophorum subsp. funduliforme 1_1_36S]|nr:hypothetical protein HMPREF9466_00481 [Fusobacterium necrophorum subsp. funduliforme 1_1_36S]